MEIMEEEVQNSTNYEYLDVIVTKLDMTDGMLCDDIKGFRKNFLNKLKQKAENTHGNRLLSKASFRQMLQILYRSMDFLNTINEEIRNEYRKRFDEELANIGFLTHYSSLPHLPSTDESILITRPDTINSSKTGSVASVNSTHSPMPLSPHDPVVDDPLVLEKKKKQDDDDDDSDSSSNSTVITKRKHKEIAEKVQNEDQEKVNKKSKINNINPKDKISKEMNDSDATENNNTIDNESDKGESEPFVPDYSSIVIPNPPQTIKLVKKTPEQKQKENLVDSLQQDKEKTLNDDELQNIEEAMKEPVPYKTEINEDVLTHPDLNENDLEIIDEEVPGSSRNINTSPSSKNQSKRNQSSKNLKKKGQSDSTKENPAQPVKAPVVTKEDRRKVLRMLESSDEDKDKDEVEVNVEEKQKKKEERAERKRAREEKKKSPLVDSSGNQLCHKLLKKTQIMIPKFPKKCLKELKKKKYFYVHPPPPVSSDEDEPSSEDEEERVRRAIKDLIRIDKDDNLTKKKSQPKKKLPVSSSDAKKRKGRKRKTSEVSVNMYSGSSSDSDVIILNPNPSSYNRNRSTILNPPPESEGEEFLSGCSEDDDDSFRKGFLDQGKKKKNLDNKKDSPKKKKKPVNLYVPSCAKLYVDDSDSTDEDEVIRKRRPKRNRVILSDSDDNGVNKIKKLRREADKFSDDSDAVVFESEVTRTRKTKEKEIPTVPENVEEVPLSQTHSRRNIRDIIDTSNLAKSTKDAQKDEEKRKKRLAEKNKLMNAVSSTQQTVENLILDIDPKTKEPLVIVHPILTQHLKPYQRKGVGFLWDSTIESVNSKTKEGNGCILAHCMGLGKSIQTISYIHAVLNEDRLNLKTVLVVCPKSTVLNWQQEFKKWYRYVQNRPTVYDLSMSKAKTSQEKADTLQEWYTQGGVGIIHYDAFENLSRADLNLAKNRMKTTEEERKIFRDGLINPGPDIIICDEGHRLKNEKNQLSKALAEVVSRRRIILTGTPLQNNLEEYYTMMNFVKPNFLGTLAEFRNRFVNPISNGQHKDSSAADVKLMKKRAHILHKTLDSSVQRLDYQILMPMLPAKEEYVIHINLSEIQIELYDYYLKNVAKVDNKSQSDIKERASVKGNFLKDFHLLQKIQAHPIILTYQLEKTKKMAQKKLPPGAENSLANPLLVEDISDNFTDSSDIEWLDDCFNKVEKFKAVNVKNEIIDPNEEGEIIIPDLILPKKPTPIPPPAEAQKIWWEEILEKANKEKSGEKKWFGFSGKFAVMRKILLECQKIGEKLVIFSSYKWTLDMIEKALAFMDQDFEQDFGRWRKNTEYYRIDGDCSTAKRQNLIDNFNLPGSKVKLFIITKTSGGIGINLIGANRVIIFDCAWNPTDDQQSLYRVFRLGQVKPVFVYRLLSSGTMESKVYNRSVVKLSLSCRVVDEQQIVRHFSNDDIYEMYKCNPKDKARTEEIPLVPNDKVFANILVEHRNWIDSYFTHDSLLENKVDECLSEEERKAAWDEFESEKSRNSEILNNGVLGNSYSQNLRDILYNTFIAQNPNGEPSEDYLNSMSSNFNKFQTEMNLIDNMLNNMSPNNIDINTRTALENRKTSLGQLINSMIINGTAQYNQQQPMNFQPQHQYMNNMNQQNQKKSSPSKARANLSKKRTSAAQAKRTQMNKNARAPPLANLQNNNNPNINQFNDNDRQGGPYTNASNNKPRPPPLEIDDSFAINVKKALEDMVAKRRQAYVSSSLNPNPNLNPNPELPQQMPMPGPYNHI